MDSFKTRQACSDYVNALNSWNQLKIAEWKNSFMVTFRARQNVPSGSHRELIQKSLNLAKNIFQKDIFGRSNMRLDRNDPRKKQIGFFPVTEYSARNNFGWHAHTLIDVPIGITKEEVQEKFYRAWLCTDMFGQKGYAPSYEEKKLLKEFPSIAQQQNIVHVIPVTDTGASSYLNKKTSKSSDTDFALQLYQLPKF